MASNIISSFKAFGEKFKVPEKGERTDALKKYFARGGVISCVKSNGAWPKLIYPSPLRIKVQAKELEAILAQYEARQKDWKKKLEDAKSYHSRHQILKLKEPLYWQHKAKELSDSDYRQDAKSGSLPVHLVADPKKAKEKLGWQSKTKFEDIVKTMLKHDLEKRGLNDYAGKIRLS